MNRSKTSLVLFLDGDEVVFQVAGEIVAIGDSALCSVEGFGGVRVKLLRPVVGCSIQRRLSMAK